MGRAISKMFSQIVFCVILFGSSLLYSFDCIAMESTSESSSGNLDMQESAVEYINEATGYCAKVEDTAGLLSREQCSLLLEDMKGITAYGNVAFHSTDRNSTTASSYAQQYYYSQFGSDSGTIFLIDMNNRMLYIFSNGSVYRIITKGRADTITDNIYTYATNGDYYTCAAAAFSQELVLLEGGRISQPMKYISNGLLALVFALLINYCIVRLSSGTRKPSDEEVLKGLTARQNLMNFQVQQTHSDRVYSPRSSGGGGSGGGGGGGGGGGHSF